MIRALALVVALALGLAAAVGIGGRMAHLRAAFGSNLPDWTTTLDADAGMISGHGLVAGADLRWQLVGVDTQGGRWLVVVSGTDWQVQGVAHWRGGALTVASLIGIAPGAWVAGGSEGIIAVTGGTLSLSPLTGQIAEGQIDGTARDVVLAGVPVSGPVSLIWQDGAWRPHP